jgi:hypothetical protein
MISSTSNFDQVVYENITVVKLGSSKKRFDEERGAKPVSLAISPIFR